MNRLSGEAWLISKQKRMMDLAIASSLLPVLTPLVAVSAAAISVTELELPFIVQSRYGLAGALLKIAKLRTMPRGTTETMSNGHYDPRRTKLGRPLSATRIDEAPQLWNVLTGSMSMVGLRPLVRTHHDEFVASLPARERIKVLEAYAITKPGWFDPYGVNLYVDGVEDTHEARAESIIKYTFEEASARKDIQIMLHAFGILNNLVRDTGVELLPTQNPPLEPKSD